MKYYCGVWLILTMFSGMAQALEPTIEIIEQFDDIKLVAFVKQSDVQNYPVWNPIADMPPLSIRQAIQDVQEYASATNGGLPVDSVQEIELRKIPQHSDYWHYLIKTDSSAKTRASYQVYVVLMNGRVIPALMEPESYK